MPSVPTDSDQKVRDRIDLNRKVVLRFEKFQDFLTEIAANISTGGMFVRSDKAHEPGEQFEFECSLADGYPLVSGRAEVVWIRTETASNDRPIGMGVRFLQLADKSETLIRRIVEQRIKTGEKPFELERERPSGSTETPTEPSAKPSAATSPPVSTVPAADRASQAPEIKAPAAPSRAASEAPPPRPPGAGTPPVGSPAPPSTGDSRRSPLPVPPASRAAASRGVTSPSSTPASGSKPPPAPPSAQPRRPTPPIASVPSGPRVAAAAPVRPARSGAPSTRVGATPSKAPVRSSAGVGDRKKLGLVRILELVLLSVLAGAFMVLAFNQYWVRPRIERLEAKLEELTGTSGVESPAVLAQAENPPTESNRIEPRELGENVAMAGGQEVPASEPAAMEIAAAPEPRRELRPEPRDAVQGWARAWSEQRVDDYLAYYSASFVPASGLSRATWEQRRRERLLEQGAIRVAVVSFRVEELAPDEVRVTFTQSYRSNVYRDRVRKSLRMFWIDDRWRIEEEVVIRQLPW